MRVMSIAPKKICWSPVRKENRPEATCAALIPIRKSAAWWELAQDERREILETNSKHIAVGLKYLPAIARRLHHSRELGEEFDFLTWFEYAPEKANEFDELVKTLRETEEWNYVEREIDIRVQRIWDDCFFVIFDVQTIDSKTRRMLILKN